MATVESQNAYGACALQRGYLPFFSLSDFSLPENTLNDNK